MRKEDLNNGAIVQTRNGEKLLFFKKANFWASKQDVFIGLKDGCHTIMDRYNDDLTHVCDCDFDIMLICDKPYVGRNIECHISTNIGDWTWKRDEEKVVTLQEIADKFGVDVSELRIKE